MFVHHKPLSYGTIYRPLGIVLRSTRWTAQCTAFGICLNRSAIGQKGVVSCELCNTFKLHNSSSILYLIIRLWWALAFLLSVGGCGYLIWNVYKKWDDRPVIVSFAENSTPVWEIPFPAITICPETKINTTVLNFTQIVHELTNSEPTYNVTDCEE